MKSMHKNSERFRPTYVLIAANVVVYALTAILSGSINVSDTERGFYLILQYGQYNEFVLNGAYYQLFTAMFIHVTIIHIIGNMFFLLIFGLRAEEVFSIWEYLAVYLLSGLAGNLLTLFLLPATASPSAGASGAIFGMFGAVAVYMRRSIGQSIVSAIIFGFFLLLMSAGFQVNILAHLGGLVLGIAIGFILGTLRRTPPLPTYLQK